jgi:benzylsuccinate CoA-transferase BbsF subunit
MAIIAALDYKRRTGKGQYIDTSMVEVCTHANTPDLLEYQAGGRYHTRNGNHVDYASPHAVFPCKGDDRWCAIAVFNDYEWQALCRTPGMPARLKDPKFSSLESRKQNEAELEHLISEWTVQFTDYEVMNKLQAAGVPSGVVQTMEDILDHDPQLKEREFLLSIENPELGIFGHPTPAYKLTKTKAKISRAPLMGEHTEYVCISILGLSDREFAELAGQNVFE